MRISGSNQPGNAASGGANNSPDNETGDTSQHAISSNLNSLSHQNAKDEGAGAGLTSAELLAAEPTTTERILGGVDTKAADDGTTSSPALDNAVAATQGTMGLAAREGIGSESARISYNLQAGALDPADTAGRTELKAATRADTPPVTRAIINSVRPDLGPKSGTSGNATHTNFGANRLADTLGKMGRGAAAVGVVMGVTRIATAENKFEEAAKVGGGVVGGIGAGALAGAQLGAMGANPLTIGVGAVAGAVIGGIAGEAAVDTALNWAKSWF